MNASPGLSWRVAAILTVPPLAWAANAVLGRFAVGVLPPVMFNFLRWVVVALALAPLGWGLWRRGVLRRHAGWLALAGLLGMGCYNALQYIALHTSSALNVTLIAASSPVWMLLVGALRHGVRPRRAQVAGAVLSLAGVLLVIARGSWERLAQVQLASGDLLMLVAIWCWAFYSWMLARPPAGLREALDAKRGWAELLLAQVLFGLAWCALAAGVEAVVAPQPWQLDLRVGAMVVFVGLVPGLLAYVCWGRGVAAVGPTIAGFFGNLTPLFAALLSAALLGEPPRAFHGIAFALIVAGIVVSSRQPRR